MRGLLAGMVLILLLSVYELDARTGATPFQHLYYVPIVIAAIALPPYGAIVAAGAAIVLYHAANPRLLTLVYREPDVVQIALFLGIGIVTGRLADDARRLHRIAETDDLTGLYNLRGFEPRLASVLASARRTLAPVAMLVIDLDRLKGLNDSYGHRAGADAVRLVGTVIAQCLPSEAFASRFGGDEFVVALPGYDADAASGVAIVIRDTVHRIAPTLGGLPFPAGTLSISAGVAAFMTVNSSGLNDEGAGERLFRAADNALYAAKAAGRNQISLAPP